MLECHSPMGPHGAPHPQSPPSLSHLQRGSGPLQGLQQVFQEGAPNFCVLENKQVSISVCWGAVSFLCHPATDGCGGVDFRAPSLGPRAQLPASLSCLPPLLTHLEAAAPGEALEATDPASLTSCPEWKTALSRGLSWDTAGEQVWEGGQESLPEREVSEMRGERRGSPG